MNWIYPLTIVLYSISVSCYFVDFLLNNRRVNRVAFWLLSVVWLLQTGYFLIRAYTLEYIPIISQTDGLFFYAWTLVTVSLMINWFFRVDFLVFFTNLVGFAMLAFSLFATNPNHPVELQHLLSLELMVIHISFIFLSYAAFTLAFAFSIMYVLSYQMLKRKNWSKRLQRFGSLTSLDKMAFRSTLIGAPLLLIGIIQGVIWATVELDQFIWYDTKVLTSFLTLGIYLVYLYNRVVKHKQGYEFALLNIAGFLVLCINYFLSSQYTSFHLW
ncbi:cytochrome C assembly family protein [Alkalihalobacillus pseudalcaliphilus]|uniref:cytochrome C assembly family protein n=1 Tax=Alkalihalobacillus pseudalcaliphilus TaxID=79884 RepID=UPI00064E0B6B|nr:cytochrome c biogenesis protein [Alkalihalobacillus pseudalcaliphilus]KMK74636.1 cytochrome C assembly protein [Alkalihalobacillus pseudalcaliphilus]